MPTLKARLEKLETVLKAPPRQIVVRMYADAPMTEEEMHAFLASQGVDVRDEDLFLILRTFTLPGQVEGDRLPNPRLVSVTER